MVLKRIELSMSRKHWKARVLESWTNGSMADIYLTQNECGEKAVRKCYRSGFLHALMREYLTLTYLSRLPIVPRIVQVRILHRELILSYLPGVRVLEWVLKNYGDPRLDLRKYHSYHGLETDQDIDRAFCRFRNSHDTTGSALKGAISSSYAMLHGTGFTHGDPSPRNLIYDGELVYLIDFDHARPSPGPGQIDRRSLERWYAVEPPRQSMGSCRKVLIALESYATNRWGS